jgi:RNA polymerase sigma-70 factor (ECF subfamily)
MTPPLSAFAEWTQPTRQDEATKALTLAYKENREPLFGFCLAKLGDAHLAEDVVQETFLRAHANLHRLDHTRSLLPWLYTTALRQCIDIRRRSVAASRNSRYLLEEGSDVTLQDVLERQTRRELAIALKRLPHRQQRALLLNAHSDLGPSGIAREEGISPVAAKGILARARMSMRHILSAQATHLVP